MSTCLPFHACKGTSYRPELWTKAGHPVTRSDSSTPSSLHTDKRILPILYICLPFQLSRSLIFLAFKTYLFSYGRYSPIPLTVFSLLWRPTVVMKYPFGPNSPPQSCFFTDVTLLYISLAVMLFIIFTIFVRL